MQGSLEGLFMDAVHVLKDVSITSLIYKIYISNLINLNKITPINAFGWHTHARDTAMQVQKADITNSMNSVKSRYMCLWK